MNVFIIFVLLTMGNISLGAKPRDIQKKMKHQRIRLKIIEGRLDLLESKHDVNSDVISKIAERLANLESYLNTGITEIDPCMDVNENGNKHDLSSNEASLNAHAYAETDIWRIMEAFHQEKVLNKFLRKEISDLQNALSGQYKVVAQIENDLQSLKSASSTAEELREQSNGVLSNMITDYEMLNSSIDDLIQQINGDYSRAFGDFDGEFWLGNDLLSEMTVECCYELRIDLEDFERNKAYAKYGKFQVLPKEYDYKLVVEDYSGDAGGSLKSHSRKKISTNDRDLDYADCEESFKGGWWYSNCHDSNQACADSEDGGWWNFKCHDSNLNGLYLHGRNSEPGKGIIWYYWKMTNKYSLKTTEMKFRKL